MNLAQKKEFYERLIIVDFDDTICIHGKDKSKISEGSPNTALINKLNELHDKGYHIHIYTARGHYSADSREEADEKHRGTIEKWLEDHSVKYDLLNFNKPYGIIYIDDKAIRHDEVSKLDNL